MLQVMPPFSLKSRDIAMGSMGFAWLNPSSGLLVIKI